MIAVPSNVKKEDFDKVYTKKRPKKSLITFIEDFVNGEADIAEVMFDNADYKSIEIAYSCIGTSIRKHFAGVCRIKARNGKLYLVKL